MCVARHCRLEVLSGGVYSTADPVLLVYIGDARFLTMPIFPSQTPTGYFLPVFPPSTQDFVEDDVCLA